MAELILYMSPGTCSRVTMTALEEIDVPFEDRLIFTGAGAQNSAAYLAVNRKGKVPALSVDGQVLTENPAILAYLDAQHPAAGLLPRGDDPLVRAQGLSDMAWCSSTLHINVRQIRNPLRLTVRDPDGVREDGLKKLAKECDYIAGRIGDGWWYGSTWSIVDTYVYWAYSTAAAGGFPIGDYPVLTAHAERVRARPSFQRMLDRERAAIEHARLPIDPSGL